MPWIPHDRWAKAHAEWYIARYHDDPDFKLAESQRKAGWYAIRASDPAWLSAQAEKKRLQRAAKKKITKKP